MWRPCWWVLARPPMLNLSGCEWCTKSILDKFRNKPLKMTLLYITYHRGRFTRPGSCYPWWSARYSRCRQSSSVAVVLGCSCPIASFRPLGPLLKTRTLVRWISPILWLARILSYSRQICIRKIWLIASHMALDYSDLFRQSPVVFQGATTNVALAGGLFM